MVREGESVRDAGQHRCAFLIGRLLGWLAVNCRSALDNFASSGKPSYPNKRGAASTPKGANAPSTTAH